jgi:hypothetical protein
VWLRVRVVATIGALWINSSSVRLSLCSIVCSFFSSSSFIFVNCAWIVVSSAVVQMLASHATCWNRGSKVAMWLAVHGGFRVQGLLEFSQSCLDRVADFLTTDETVRGAGVVWAVSGCGALGAGHPSPEARD